MRLPFQLLALAAAILSPLSEASSSKRNPIGALSTVQNATIHTKNRRVTAVSNFDLSFIIRDDLHVKFSLEPNHDILPNEATVTYLAADGSVERKEPVDRLDHKVFKGTAWVQRPKSGQAMWQNVGWARALILRDGEQPFFEGAFSVDHDHHHIQGSKNYMQTRHHLDPEIRPLDNGEQYMVLWRDSDVLTNNDVGRHQELKRAVFDDVPTCQAEGLSFNINPEHPVFAGMPSTQSYGVMDFNRIFKRQIDSTTGGNSAGVDLKSTIGQSAGCPTTRKVALVGVAADCNYRSSFDDERSMRENVISQMNTASAVWEDAFMISLGLQNLTVLPPSCPGTPAPATEWNQACSGDVDIQARLNMFSAWRGQQGGDNSHWTLLSTCNTGSAVGLAWLGQACVNTAISSNTSYTGNGDGGEGTETVTGANVVIRTGGANEWAIIAHETGHTFGAVHDCDSQTCADSDIVNSQQCCPLSATTCDASGGYIMNPFTEPGVNKFSPCSIGNVCSGIGRNSVNIACLSDNKNIQTITGQQCGNGIVEEGEDCDCGGTEGCGDDPCCDATTCKFVDGAVCDDANEECCSNCQFSSKGTVCRDSAGECDPQEVCAGDNGNCPADKVTPNGQSCGDGLQCASGQCTSRDQQCKTVMGSYTRGNDTSACDSQGCTISCSSPEFGYGTCYGLQQNFLDGTNCGGNGHCQNGQCKGNDLGGEIKSWIDDHKAIVIGVCSGVGALLLFSLLCCCRRRHQRRKWQKQMPQRPPQPPPGGWQGWNNRGAPPPPPPHYQNQMSQNMQPGWYGPPAMSGARGSGGWQTPPPPPPTYQRQDSVRYG